jgi:copper(I)-binding protein
MRPTLIPLAAVLALAGTSLAAAFTHLPLDRVPAPARAIAVAMTEGEAHPVKAGDLTLTAGWLRAMLPGQPAGGGYVTISNAGSTPDRLVAVSTPAAGKSEIHMMEMKNDVMVMRPVDGGLEIPAGGTVELKPGGFHLMFMQMTEPFAEGATVPVTLEFEKAGKVELMLPVKAASGAAGHTTHGG